MWFDAGAGRDPAVRAGAVSGVRLGGGYKRLGSGCGVVVGTGGVEDDDLWAIFQRVGALQSGDRDVGERAGP